MVTTPALARKRLLSLNPQLQLRTARSLGFTAPHRELPLIASTLRSDLGDHAILSNPTAKALCNAIYSHLGLVAIQPTHAQQDTLAKATDAHRAILQWAMAHGRYRILAEHIEMVERELQRATERYGARGEVAA